MALSQNLTGAALGLLAFAAYSAYDAGAKYLGASLHPLQIIAVAGLMHLPLLFAYALWQGGSLWPKAPKLMTIRAGATVINYIAGVSAFTLVPMAEAYILFFTMPLMIAVLAVPVLGERFDLIRGFAVLLGLAGVIIALDPTVTTLGLGHALAFTGAVVGALNYVLIRKTGAVEQTSAMLLWPQLALVPIVAAATPFVYRPMEPFHLAVAALMATALLAASAAIIAAYRRASAIIIAPMQYSQIAWAAILGAVFFAETLGKSMLYGCLLIIAAGVIVVVHQEQPSRQVVG